ncbi:hypothetical protein [Pseudosulfitobacter pseudonitzschiae]|nr:hypothetical protein [Pseudosulfitobacter pseudonitzschiae]MBM1814295.1 hypothetical protein [Pseudosulfitobacter pseudonitzschiae]MBM1836155.1 hypothetical protein [Pseudosulfitobacter pseudonitzschiae]MBM1841001.1 hypothetical protein [Pseudosulfitobacter pseudonitzschiae]MBM1845010.1 hypothetical protein [Pseudosulfitobacter pseudonitzschiae]MBM1849850.1 hypothetical protein [Pseudosulfitobacter pseudonitzschiae]
MQTSIFLAQLIGPVLALMGLFVAIHPTRVEAMGREVLESPTLLLLAGLLALVPGLAIVLSHNIWVADWRAVITVLGWIMLVAGTSRILLPGLMQKMGDNMLRHRALIMVPSVLMLALGGYLIWVGYLTQLPQE